MNLPPTPEETACDEFDFKSLIYSRYYALCLRVDITDGKENT